MADTTIGLDFGTHQSKVCVEDSSDPRNITYTFFEFKKPDGKMSFFLPSVVQINKDDTLSYGFCDPSKAKVLGTERAYKEPVLVLPDEPKYDPFSKEPQRKNPPTIQEYINILKRGPKIYVKVKKGEKYTKWEKGKYKEMVAQKDMKVLADLRKYAPEHIEEYIDEQDKKYRAEHFKWEMDKRIVELRNERLRNEWIQKCDKARAIYEEQHNLWEHEFIDILAVYRYFKIATFSKRYDWKQKISPKIISAWYLTFVLFHLYEKYEETSPVQMGIPQSISDKAFSDVQIKNAEDVFYQALKLYRHFCSLQEFLKAKVDELLELTTFETFEPDYDKDPGLLMLPEAFASLVPITREGKISQGMTLLLDIGGGSTDISLFNVIPKRDKEYLPNIAHIISYHHGLNHVFRMYSNDHIGVSIEDARAMFEKYPEKLTPYVQEFESNIVKLIDTDIYRPLMKAAEECGADVKRFSLDLIKRPVIFTGGGGVYEVFHNKIHTFYEPLSVADDLLSLKSISNKNVTQTELSILSVAYGLANSIGREPVMTPLKELFVHIHILPEKKDDGYEHGLSDFS